MSLALALAVLMGVFGLIFAWLAGWFGDIIFPDEDVPTQDDFKEALRQNPAAIREALRQVAAANGTTPGGGGAAAAAAAAARRVPQRPSDAELGLCGCLLYTSPSPRDRQKARMPSSA